MENPVFRGFLLQGRNLIVPFFLIKSVSDVNLNNLFPTWFQCIISGLLLGKAQNPFMFRFRQPQLTNKLLNIEMKRILPKLMFRTTSFINT